MPDDLTLDRHRHRYVLRRLGDRLESLAFELSLPPKLTALLWHAILPELYDPPDGTGLQPCAAPAGHPDRVAAYAERADAGRPLWHPHDSADGMPARLTRPEDDVRPVRDALLDRRGHDDGWPVGTVTEAVARWADVLGRRPDTLAREVERLRGRVTRLKADLASQARAALSLRQELRAAKAAARQSARLAGKVTALKGELRTAKAAAGACARAAAGAAGAARPKRGKARPGPGQMVLFDLTVTQTQGAA